MTTGMAFLQTAEATPSQRAWVYIYASFLLLVTQFSAAQQVCNDLFASTRRRPAHRSSKNPRGVFLRGKNFGHYADVEEVDLGTHKGDTVGPHSHNQRFLNPSAAESNVGGSILWDRGKR